MSTLVLELAGPMQAWGDDSRFVRRSSRMMPTKSGVIGILAAALGRRRTDPLEDLVNLRFGVRQEQQGTLSKDFQTAIDWRTGKSKPLSNRYYVHDASYLVAIEADRTLCEGLAEAITSPVFPLYLGRRACPPAKRMIVGIRDTSVNEVLEHEPWRASDWYRKQQADTVHLPWSRDAVPGEQRDETVRDVPISFDPRQRKYGWRDVVHGWTQVSNELGKPTTSHDELALLGAQS